MLVNILSFFSHFTTTQHLLYHHHLLKKKERTTLFIFNSLIYQLGLSREMIP